MVFGEIRQAVCVEKCQLKIVEDIASCDPRELKETLNKAAESPEIRRLILLHPEYALLLEPRKSSEGEE